VIGGFLLLSTLPAYSIINADDDDDDDEERLKIC
jgi:hypothetical protein